MSENYIVESGVAFPDSAPNFTVSVSAAFAPPGEQMSVALIGSEPVIIVQPELDADRQNIDLVTTVIGLHPEGLVDVLEKLLDAAREIAAHED